MTLNIYVGSDGDTLRTIAHRYGSELSTLLTANPHIPHPDMKLSGIAVRIPTGSSPIKIRITETSCPPEPVPDMKYWIPLTPIEQMAATPYDVLIVGTGAGGGSLLWRLCEHWRREGKRIGVIERGGLQLPTHSKNIATMEQEMFEGYYRSNSYPIGSKLPEYPGARVVYALGGRTLYWGTVSPRVAESEFAQHWPIDIKEFIPYYLIAEQLMKVTTDYTADAKFTQAVLKRLRANGFPEARDIPVAIDLQPSGYGKIRSNVFFSSIVLLARALSMRPFDLAVNARAIEVLTEGGKAAGLRVITPERKTHVLKAKIIVLAASTLETPRILLNSNIPGRAIGHYLRGQTFLTANAYADSSGLPDILGPVGVLVPQSEDRPFQLQIEGPLGYFWYQYREKPRADDWRMRIFSAFGNVEARYENYVYLDPRIRDAYDVPEIRVNFNYSEKDMAVAEEMEAALRRAASAAGMQFKAGDSQPLICQFAPGSDNHDHGTCRMGNNPDTSATNRYGQIHGVNGLYVADNSVLPSVGATNPTLTTVAAAIRTADYIARRNG